ncbi:MAG: hypothetical protein WCX74_02050 [Candidatus Paceibacterota bacterium]
MNTDYEIDELDRFIDIVRSFYEKDGFNALYIKLFSLRDYFRYSVSEIRTQEENLELMKNGEHNNFATNEEYQESEMRIFSCAISSYGHMRTCLHFVRMICKEKDDPQLLAIREKYKKWAENLVDKRDRIQAHPHEEWAIAGEVSGRNSNGEVYFNTRDFTKSSKSRKITLTPRKDLEILRSYLKEISIYFINVLSQNHQVKS